MRKRQAHSDNLERREHEVERVAQRKRQQHEHGGHEQPVGRLWLPAALPVLGRGLEGPTDDAVSQFAYALAASGPQALRRLA